MPLARKILLYFAAILFILGGALHFLKFETYLQVMPPYFPAPRLLVAFSGAAEIAGGIGLLLPRLRRAAGWGLIALLIAVFPANIYMAQHPERFHFAAWLLWARLPFQAIFIGWVWFVSLARQSR